MKRLMLLALEWRPDFVIVILGLMSISMGLWLIFPADTFATSQTYSILESTAPEWVWGLLMIIPGVLKATGTICRRWGMSRTGCRWGFFVWMFFSISFIQANPLNPLGIVLFWKAILNAWFILHIQSAIAESEHRKKRKGVPEVS